MGRGTVFGLVYLGCVTFQGLFELRNIYLRLYMREFYLQLDMRNVNICALFQQHLQWIQKQTNAMMVLCSPGRTTIDYIE